MAPFRLVVGQVFIEAEIIGMDRVEGFSQTANELHFEWIVPLDSGLESISLPIMTT